MRNILLLIGFLLFGYCLPAQTDCVYKISFRLEDTNGKLIKRLRHKKLIWRNSFINEYAYQNQQHFFTLSHLGSCEYQLQLKKKGKKLQLNLSTNFQVHERHDLGTIILKDTTLYFREGIASDGIIKKEIVIPKRPEYLIFPKLEVYDSVEMILITKRVAIDPNYSPELKTIEKYLGYDISGSWRIYGLGQNSLDTLLYLNQQLESKIIVGQAVQLNYLEFGEQAVHMAAYFGDFKVHRNLNYSEEEFKLFLKENNYEILKENDLDPAFYQIRNTNLRLNIIEDFKFLKASDYFSFVEPIFQYRNASLEGPVWSLWYNKKRKIEIDSIQFYLGPRTDKPPPDISARYKYKFVWAKDRLLRYEMPKGLYNYEGAKLTVLPDSLLLEAQFLIDAIPKKYRRIFNTAGNCNYPVTQEYYYECFTIVLYKTDEFMTIIRGHQLPEDLKDYFFKAKAFFEKIIP